jgi:hypothetical protein
MAHADTPLTGAAASVASAAAAAAGGADMTSATVCTAGAGA